MRCHPVDPSRPASRSGFRQALIFVSLILVSALSHAQSTTPTPTWTTNGPVYSIATTSQTIFLGGLFTKVGQLTGSAVPLSAATGQPGAGPRVNGTVFACESDGAGGWFIGGSFTQVGTVTRNNLAHIRADGTLDMSWNPNPNSTVYDLKRDGTRLYVAGSFIFIGAKTRNYITALNTVTGANDNSFNPGADGIVRCLVLDGTTVYAGGQFHTIGGQPRNYIASLDDTGVPQEWIPDPNGAVECLAFAEGVLYAGGSFTSIYGTPCNHLAAIDSGGSPMAWSSGANGAVSAIAVSGTTVYVGGSFNMLGGQYRPNLGAVDAFTGVTAAWAPGMDAAVNALAVGDGVLYAGGAFGNSGAQGRGGLAAFDAATGVLTAWNPGADQEVKDLAYSDGTVYAAGSFVLMNSVARANLAALDAVTGRDAGLSLDTDGEVRALAYTAHNLYVGGAYATICGEPRDNFAMLDPVSGVPGESLFPANGAVNTMVTSGTTLYIGGDFTLFGGPLRRYLAALDLANNILSPWDPGANWTVNALAADGGLIYAGGLFTNVGGQVRNRLAAMDAAGAVTAWDPDANGAVNAVAVAAGQVFAGGSFTTLGGLSRPYLAVLEADTGLLHWWDLNVNASVNALRAVGTKVYAGGAFAFIGGQSRYMMAGLDAQAHSLLAWNPPGNDLVRAIAATSSTICVGGSFTKIGGQLKPYFARFDTPPAAPSNPSAGNIQIDQVAFNWQDNSSNETGFKIWADPGTGIPTTLRTTTAANATSWTYGGLSANSPVSFQAASTGMTDSAKTGSFTAYTLIEPITGFTFALDTTSLSITPSNTISNITEGSSGIMYVDLDEPGTSVWQQSLAPFTYSGLTPNAEYTFTAKSRNALGIETPIHSETRFTLASAPTLNRNVACAIPVQTTQSLGVNFVFSNPAGFGFSTDGGSAWMVNGYRYVWNSSSTYTFDGSEAVWDAGTLSRIPPAPGNYYLHLQSVNNEGEATPETLDFGPFVVMIAPFITTQPVSVLADPATDITFSIVAGGSEPLHYQWYKNGSLLAGATSSTLVIRTARASDEGTYLCQVRNSMGTDLSFPATLDLRNAGRLTPLGGGALNFAEGTPYAVDVELGGAPTTQTIRLVNTGIMPITFVGGTPPGLALTGPNAADFQIVNATPATTLPLDVGSTISLVIRFAPTEIRRTLGLRATLVITTDSPLTPTVNIPILADAVPVELSRFKVD